MQDRYAGDVGDFLKYGLLRWLVAPTEDSPGRTLRLGVLWYLTPDEGHNNDGKHVTYLEPTHRVGATLRRLDPDLHHRLGHVVTTGRSIAAIERSGALPHQTRFFSERLDYTGVPTNARPERLAHRDAWLTRALHQLADTDLVFADPDNGIRHPHHTTGRHRDTATKHAYIDELARFAAQGHAIVVYHHADRSAPVNEQALRRLDDLAEHIERPLAAVRARRGTNRLFLITGTGPTADHLNARLNELENSAWSHELTVVRPNHPASVATAIGPFRAENPA